MCVLTITLLDRGQKGLPKTLQTVDYDGIARIEICTLEQCDLGLNSRQKQLLQSWETLHTAKVPDAEILVHILVVLSETIIGECDRAPLPALAFGQDAAEPVRRPTAAHPRAYKGTKYQPPKSREPIPVDLSPYLCDEQSISLILTRLRAFWPDAIAKLSLLGYNIAVEFPSKISTNVASNFASGLPLPFEASLLSQLRGQEKGVVNQCLALYWKLEMEATPVLLATFARLLTLQSKTYSLMNILKWGEFVLLQPAEYRVVFMTMLAETRALHLDPFTLAPSITQAISELYAQPFWQYRLYCLMRAIGLGLDGEYIIAGFALANECDEDYLFHEATQCGAIPIEHIKRLNEHICLADNWYDTKVMRLWQQCGEFPAFAQVLTTVDWWKYAPKVAASYLNTFLNVPGQDWPHEKKRKTWEFISHNVPAIERLLASISPDYHFKCLYLLETCIWDWKEGVIAQNLVDFSFALLKRLCAPPFRTRPFDDGMLPQWARNLNEEERQTFIDAPQSSFMRRDKHLSMRPNRALCGWKKRVYALIAGTLYRLDFILCFVWHPAGQYIALEATQQNYAKSPAYWDAFQMDCGLLRCGILRVTRLLFKTSPL